MANINKLKQELKVAFEANNYAGMATIASSIKKLEHAEKQALIEAAQAKLLELTMQIRKDMADKNSELSKAIRPYYKQAKELIGAENACFSIYLDQKELDVKIVKHTPKKHNSNGSNGPAITVGEPATDELVKLYPDVKAQVRWDKTLHEGTFTQLLEAAKNAVDKNNASFNLRIAVVKYHKSQQVAK